MARIVESKKEGLQDGYTRATFIVREDLLDELKDLAYTNRTTIKDEINIAIEKHIEGKDTIERTVELIGKERVDQCYIYALLAGDQIVYIGQTINLDLRIQDHKYSGKEFDRYKYMVVDVEEANKTELSLIKEYTPKYNKQGNGHNYVPYKR